MRNLALPRCIFRASIQTHTRPHVPISIRQRASHSVRHYGSKRKDYDPNALYNIRNPVRAAAIVCAIVFSYRAYEYYFLSDSRIQHLDAPPSSPSEAYTSGVKVDLTARNAESKDASEKVPTGVSKVPYFPKTISLPRSGANDSTRDETVSAALPAGTGGAAKGADEEYTLMGLGVRTVSFLSIQVYVVGFYVAKADIGRLQEELVRAYMPGGMTASTLVQGEKEDLRRMLLDGLGSEAIWTQVLKEGGVRSAVRIVPTRDTNFGHLRDGWLRGIDTRGKGADFADADFKSAVDEFKGVMSSGGSVGRGRVLLLGRGTRGDLGAWVEEDAATKVEAEQQNLSVKGNRMSNLGNVRDERVSRLVWMNYLAGKTVASEAARKSVIDGVMGVVERPIGTVETQVV